MALEKKDCKDYFSFCSYTYISAFKRAVTFYDLCIGKKLDKHLSNFSPLLILARYPKVFETKSIFGTLLR